METIISKLVMLLSYVLLEGSLLWRAITRYYRQLIGECFREVGSLKSKPCGKINKETSGWNVGGTTRSTTLLKGLDLSIENGI